jgi:hypothetical protein
MSFDRERCRTECFLENLKKLFGCLPFITHSFTAEIDKHFISENYTLCEGNTYINASGIDKDCYFKCIPECDIVYNSKRVVMRFYEKANVTKVNLIPIDFPHLRFIETFKTDINELIYNLGIILGLWFGLSPTSIAQLISIMLQKIKKIYVSTRRKISLIVFLVKQYEYIGFEL